MKYKPQDFNVVAPDEDKKNLVVPLTKEQRSNMKKNAMLLGVSMAALARRCLEDAGAFNVKEEEEDTEPLLNLGR